MDSKLDFNKSICMPDEIRSRGNHCLDLMVPGQENLGEAVFLDIDSSATPTCTYVPRQLSRAELLKLLPEKWITSYEQTHRPPPAPVQTTTAPDFIRHTDGLVEVKFSSSESANPPSNVFPTGIHMIKSSTPQHIWRDVCDCPSCLDDADKLVMDEDPFTLLSFGLVCSVTADFVRNSHIRKLYPKLQGMPAIFLG